MDKQQVNLNDEIYKANRIIDKLQQEIGRLSGYIARLETENEVYAQYVMQKENEKKDQEDGDTEEEDPMKKKAKNK